MSFRGTATWLALTAALVLTPAKGVGADGDCAQDQLMGLSLVYSVNRTGHPQIKIRLDQPTERQSWKLDVNMWTSKCGEQQKPSLTILELSMNGDFLPESALHLPPSVPPGYVQVANYGYYKQSNISLTWEAARDFCKMDGGVLALPSTQHEMDAIVALLPNATILDSFGYIWMGASDILTEGTWVSETGSLLDMATSIKHSSSNINNGPLKNCLFYWTKYKDLNDEYCDSIIPFYCKLNV